MQSIKEWQRAVHALATEKGWWDDVPRDDLSRVQMTPDQILAKLMLVVGEVAEAHECVRRGELETRGGHLVPVSPVIATHRDPFGAPCVMTKPEGLPIELADAVIRILDLTGAMGIDLAQAIETKHYFNRSRPYRHGGKAA